MSALLCSFCIMALIIYIIAISILLTPRKWSDAGLFAALIVFGCLYLIFMCFVVIA